MLKSRKVCNSITIPLLLLTSVLATGCVSFKKTEVERNYSGGKISSAKNDSVGSTGADGTVISSGSGLAGT